MTFKATLSALFSAASVDEYIEIGLQVLRAAQIDTTSWREGSPTKALLHFVAECFAKRDEVAVAFARSGFRKTATGAWLTLHAADTYGITRGEGSYAAPSVTLRNSGGGLFDEPPGSVLLQNSTTGVVYANAAPVQLSAVNEETTVVFVCNTVGSEGSVGADEIDSLVTNLLGVEIVSSSAAVGYDEQSDAALDLECERSLGALSPNGPPGAYAAVALNSELTGTEEPALAESSIASDTGEVTVWVAGASGPVSEPALTAVTSAVALFAHPLVGSVTVEHATERVEDFTFTVGGVGLPADVQSIVDGIVAGQVGLVQIGGVLTIAALTSPIFQLLLEQNVSRPSVFCTSHAADIALAQGQRLLKGTVGTTVA